MSGQKDSEFANSYLIYSDFLISAVGQLNLPREPDIPGLKDFQGKMMHSARWDWSYDLSGKRIAIIGNGIYFFRLDTLQRTAADGIQEQPPLKSSQKLLQWHPT